MAEQSVPSTNFKSWPLILSNAVSLVFVGAILGMKIRYG